MNCEEFRESVSELARQEILTPEASEHAGLCPRCAAELAGHRALAAGLRALAAGTRVEAPEAVERILRDAVARRGRRRLAMARWYGAAAAAAVVLLLASAPLWKPHRTVETAPKFVPEKPARRVEPGQVPVEPTAADRRIVARKPRARQESRYLAERAPVWDFAPLDFTAGLAPIEAGQVVRVRLPVDDQSGVLVQADILVGEDGVARAIRLVQ